MIVFTIPMCKTWEHDIDKFNSGETNKNFQQCFRVLLVSSVYNRIKWDLFFKTTQSSDDKFQFLIGVKIQFNAFLLSFVYYLCCFVLLIRLWGISMPRWDTKQKHNQAICLLVFCTTKGSLMNPLLFSSFALLLNTSPFHIFASLSLFFFVMFLNQRSYEGMLHWFLHIIACFQVSSIKRLKMKEMWRWEEVRKSLADLCRPLLIPISFISIY